MTRDETPEPRLTRTHLELVIRRAAELTAFAGDADERLSADELLRIGEELGLPEQYVRQALFELPIQEAEKASPVHRWLTRAFGPASTVSSRTVPHEAGGALAAIEEYLVAREFLALRRRQPNGASFEPAHDTVSAFSRAVGSLSRHYHLTHARSVAVMTQPLADREARVHVLLDFADVRRKAVRAGVLGGGILGLAVGSGAFLLVGALVAAAAGNPAGWLAGAFATLPVIAGGIAAGFAAARRRFMRRVDAARVDVEGLLDRLQAGSPLAPPPGAWLRRVRSKFRPALT